MLAIRRQAAWRRSRSAWASAAVMACSCARRAGSRAAQVGVELLLGADEGRHHVEFGARVQVAFLQRPVPVVAPAGAVAHEVEHRQDGPRAAGQDLDFGAVLGQHRLARVDHQHGAVGLIQQRAQHLGFLLEAGPRLGPGQEGTHALGARIARLARQKLQQGHRILQPRRVDKAHHQPAVQSQLDGLGVARGAGAVRHLPEVDAPRERAQQRGLAGVGVADDGNAQRLMHARTPPRMLSNQ
ncbi:hypothetical protein MASR1M50_08660 [Burkholderiales bacterium]